MAIELTTKVESRFDTEMKRIITQVECDTAYPTGGYEVDAQEEWNITEVEFAGVYPETLIDTPEYQIRVQPDDTNPVYSMRLSILSAGTEIANGTDVSDVAFNLLVIGKFRKALS